MIGKLSTGSRRSDELCGPFSRRAPVDNFPQRVEQPKNNNLTQQPVHHI